MKVFVFVLFCFVLGQAMIRKGKDTENIYRVGGKTIKGWQDGSHLSAKKKGFRVNQPCHPWSWDLQPAELRVNKFLLFKPSRLQYFFMVVLAN